MNKWQINTSPNIDRLMADYWMVMMFTSKYKVGNTKSKLKRVVINSKETINCDIIFFQSIARLNTWNFFFLWWYVFTAFH